MNSSAMAETHERGIPPIILYDRYLLLATAALLAFGLLMVASTSIVISERLYHQPFHYLYRQLLFLLLGIMLAVGVFRISMQTWQKAGMVLLIVSLGLLALVLVNCDLRLRLSS